MNKTRALDHMKSCLEAGGILATQSQSVEASLSAETAKNVELGLLLAVERCVENAAKWSQIASSYESEPVVEADAETESVTTWEDIITGFNAWVNKRSEQSLTFDPWAEA